ncbi:MAG: type IV pilus modification PilV family protein [Geminicoccaceae bacterium]
MMKPADPMITDRTARGFTLLEVLVALIIFGISFGAIAGIFQTALRQSATASTLLEARAVAEHLMARIGIELPLLLGDQTGIEMTADREALVWESRISLASPIAESDDVALYRIVVNVASEGAASPLLTLETIRIGTAP